MAQAMARPSFDSIAFGAAGTQLAGLLLASSNLNQRPVPFAGAAAVPHGSAVWMIEMESRRILQVATGGTRGETIVATSDGRILVAETGRVDEIAPLRAPNVTAVSVPDGTLLLQQLIKEYEVRYGVLAEK